MAEVNWIKITTGIFDDEKIKLIDALPENDAIFVIWIKLLILAGKANENGAIYLNEDIPYTDEMLATIFHRPLNTVRLALKTFQQFKMIEIKQSAIQIVNWEKHQNVEGLDRIREQNRIRQQKHRQKQIEDNTVTLSNVTVTEQTRIDKTRLEENRKEEEPVITTKQQEQKDKEKELGKKAKTCLDYYFQKHTEVRGFEPIVAGGRDMKLIKQILAADCSVGAFEEVTDFFFEYKKRSNFSTRALYNSFDTLYGVLLDKAERRR